MSYRQQVWSAAVAAALGLTLQPIAWAQDTVTQTVEPGRCRDFVAWIDLLMSPQPPKVKYRVEFLRQHVPTGKCDVEAVREAARSSKYFRHSQKVEKSEAFRFASDTLVADFAIDLQTREIPVMSTSIHVKKTEADYQ
ncbi:hypothetical protein LJR235_004578 [Pararhizobium sp. LjRoot235]|uniref:hypothetical protein n=1 Tax=Pararhizobium sp. LjRoot235 TaxID=3342291 RepID=UPI003ECFEA58